MVDLRVLFIKRVKKLAGESNYIANVERKNDCFCHNKATSEICTLLKVKPENVINKTLCEIHPLDEANKRRNFYERAWSGEEVLYKAEGSLNSDHVSYAVLTPVIYKGKVIRLILHVVPYYMIPIQLRGIA
jgi:hypothetical protein